MVHAKISSSLLIERRISLRNCAKSGILFTPLHCCSFPFHKRESHASLFPAILRSSFAQASSVRGRPHNLQKLFGSNLEKSTHPNVQIASIFRTLYLIHVPHHGLEHSSHPSHRPLSNLAGWAWRAATAILQIS